MHIQYSYAHFFFTRGICGHSHCTELNLLLDCRFADCKFNLQVSNCVCVCVCVCVCLSEKKKVTERYGRLLGELHMIELEKGHAGLGLSLAGNRDRSRMSVFCGGNGSQRSAGQDGHIVVGDELLEVSVCKTSKQKCCEKVHFSTL